TRNDPRPTAPCPRERSGRGPRAARCPSRPREAREIAQRPESAARWSPGVGTRTLARRVRPPRCRDAPTPATLLLGTRHRRGCRKRLVSLLAGPPRHGSPRGGRSGLGGPTITMKKISILLALTATALTLAACGGSTQERTADKSAKPAEQQPKPQATVADTTATAPTATKVAPSSGESDIATKPKIP